MVGDQTRCEWPDADRWLLTFVQRLPLDDRIGSPSGDKANVSSGGNGLALTAGKGSGTATDGGRSEQQLVVATVPRWGVVGGCLPHHFVVSVCYGNFEHVS